MPDDSPANQPLFSLDLAGNGGVLAPKSTDELQRWISQEMDMWQWVQHVQSGGSAAQSLAQERVNGLIQAREAVQQAQQYQLNNPSAFADRIASARSHLFNTYVTGALPQRDSTLGRRIASLRTVSPNRALGFLFTQMPNSQRRFDAFDMESFAGFIEGLIENHALSGIPDSHLKAALESAEALKVKTERLLGEKSAALEQLQRSYDELAAMVAELKKNQEQDYQARASSYDSRFGERVAEHQTKMAGIEATFREGMKLRGPVGYWQSRRSLHMYLAIGFGVLSFAGIGGLGFLIFTMSEDLFGKLKVGANPTTWQLTSLILVAVFGAWAARLLIRLFLSNSHLATDAAERVVMTQTYLALLEESKLSDEKDRSLILSSLFRPGSDGMIKEESIPNPTLDLLTRLSGKS